MGRFALFFLRIRRRFARGCRGFAPRQAARQATPIPHYSVDLQMSELSGAARGFAVGGEFVTTRDMCVYAHAQQAIQVYCQPGFPGSFRRAVQ